MQANDSNSFSFANAKELIYISADAKKFIYYQMEVNVINWSNNNPRIKNLYRYCKLKHHNSKFKEIETVLQVMLNFSFKLIFCVSFSTLFKHKTIAIINKVIKYWEILKVLKSCYTCTTSNNDNITR